MFKKCYPGKHCLHGVSPGKLGNATNLSLRLKDSFRERKIIWFEKHQHMGYVYRCLAAWLFWNCFASFILLFACSFLSTPILISFLDWSVSRGRVTENSVMHSGCILCVPDIWKVQLKELWAHIPLCTELSVTALGMVIPSYTWMRPRSMREYFKCSHLLTTTYLEIFSVCQKFCFQNYT